MSGWDSKVSKAALSCCRRSLDALKVVLQAWLNRGKLEERKVRPISKVVVVADEGMMAREAVGELLKEMGVKFRKSEGQGRVVMTVDGGGESFIIEVVEGGEAQGGDGLTLRVSKPGFAERVEALGVLASELGNFDLRSVAEACDGFTTLDVVRLVQFAASRSLADGRDKVEEDDFMEGVAVLQRRINVSETLPDDLSEQLYLMAVSEGGDGFSELVHRVNAGEKLDRRLEKMLARYSFILLDEPEKRIVKLAKARASYERLKKAFGGGQRS
ncbi:MAG: hypothetical protein QXW47_03300 [Candidatus Jordarchaeales archaeon]